MNIGLIDIDLGNLFSVRQALAQQGVEITTVKAPADLAACDALLLPGVGAFPRAMNALKASGLDQSIRTWVAGGKPLMGICLGMQLLMDSSEEFETTQGLGLIQGHVKKFPLEHAGRILKTPHMGWSEINPTTPHAAFEGVALPFDAYFVHSFHVVPAESSVVLSTSTHNGFEFVSSLSRDNVWAFQFHPEKSSEKGLRIYKNWVQYVASKKRIN